MADGVAITAGSGTTVATDDTAAGHVQLFKQAISTDASSALVPATADGLANVLRPETSGGLSVWSSTSDLDETEEEVKATAGQVYGYHFHNNSTSVRYLKFYANTAAGTTVGVTATLFKIPLRQGGGHITIPQGVQFATGITVACTTGYGDADTGAPTTDDVQLTVFYK
jgi:hypothetical protein